MAEKYTLSCSMKIISLIFFNLSECTRIFINNEIKLSPKTNKNIKLMEAVDVNDGLGVRLQLFGRQLLVGEILPVLLLEELHLRGGRLVGR